MADKKQTFLGKLANLFGGSNSVNTKPNAQAGFYDWDGLKYNNTRSYLWFLTYDYNQSLDAGSRELFIANMLELERNFPLVPFIISYVQTNAIGRGLVANWNTGDEDFDNLSNDLIDNQIWNSKTFLVNNQFTGYTLQKVLVRYLLLFGEAFVLLASAESGWPQIQVIEPNLVNSDGIDSDNVIDGVYIDRKNGNKPVAYSVEDGKGNYTRVAAENILHIKFNPRAANAIRGYSPFASALTSCRDWKDLMALETASVKAVSSKAIAITKNGGDLNSNDSWGSSLDFQPVTQNGITAVKAGGKNPQPAASRAFNGGITEVLAPGEKIELLESNRPSPTFNGLLAKHEENIVRAIGLDPEAVLRPDSLTGPDVRLGIQNTAIWIREFQDNLISECLEPMNIWIASKLIKLGRLPEPKDGNVFDLSFTLPASITIDAKNQNAIDIERLANGLLTREAYHSARGENWLHVEMQRIVEWQKINELRKKAGIPALPYPSDSVVVPKQTNVTVAGGNPDGSSAPSGS